MVSRCSPRFSSVGPDGVVTVTQCSESWHGYLTHGLEPVGVRVEADFRCVTDSF